MSQRLVRIAVGTALAVLLTSSTVAAQAGRGPGPGAAGANRGRPAGFGAHHFGGLHPARADRLLDRLELDDRTREQVSAIVAKVRAQDAQLRERFEHAKRALRDALQAPEPDRKSIMALAKRVGAARTDLHQLHLGLRLDVEHALPKDKRAAFRELLSRRPRLGRGPGRGRRGGRGPGMGGPRRGGPAPRP